MEQKNTTIQLVDGHTTHPGAQWYPKAELGLFIHWGTSCVHGNIDLSCGMLKDFIFGPESIHPDEYFELAKRFNPQKYDPYKWIKAAREAGFEYAALTAKHTEGFCLWPSFYGNFNTKNYMGGRDLVADYVDACRKYGMKIGLYYNAGDWWITKDYEAFDGWQEARPVPQEVKDYMRAVQRGQVIELLTRYGDIDMIWFDGRGFDFISREEIYQYQPHIIIGRGFDTDFRTIECMLPTEEQYHSEFEGHWWECCHEWNRRAWGYTKDEEYKTVEEVAHYFEVVNGYHGNLLLNVAPNPDGELPDVVYERFEEFGRWLKEYRKNKGQK